MAYFSYNPLTPAISLRFKCSNCSHIETTDFFEVPVPDWSAETHHDSVSSEDFEHVCSNCGKQYDIELHNGFYGGDGEIHDIDDCELQFVNEQIEYDSEWEYLFVEDHVKDIVKVLDNIDNLDEYSKIILYRNLYANLISIMEAYLCDCLKAEVMKSEENKRKFVETYKPFKDEKMSLSDILAKMNVLDKIIVSELNKLLYHNLGKIKPMYREILGVDLGDIGPILKCVEIRHDIVHRNGKDPEGKEHTIKRDDVEDLAVLIGTFISSIDNQINPKTLDV